MKVYGLIGKSGTGKSFQAVNLCKELNIESIIDDGLFICRNKVMAGISAKRQPTKVGAVKTALFNKDEHMEEVTAAIKKMKPSSVLVIGTSDGMVDKIAKRLDLGKIGKRIYIDDITTEAERAIAKKQRNEMGQHVIPAPTFQLKRQFSGYFMTPMRMLLREWGQWKDITEKSVVRPTYSYLGEYKISEKVMSDIAECVRIESGTVTEIGKMAISPVQEGIDIYIILNFKSGINLPEEAKRFQKEIAEKIEEMTAFNVNRLDLEVRDIV
ncbi:MAG: hypothetical protein Q4C25_07815 [Bacillota bacterium]|nr:hypothetical protein [Bacillota bacterium]